MANEITKVTDQNGVDHALVDVEGRAASVSLLDDTVGWTGKNKYKNTASSSTISSIPFVRNSDETWEVGTGTASADVWNNISGAFRLPEGKYRLTGCPESGSGSTYFLYLRNNPQSEGDISASEAGNGVEFTVTSELAQKDLVLFIAVKNGATISNPVIFKPMICTVEQYALNPAYEPYHESVEDVLTDLRLSTLRSNAFANNIASGGDLNTYLTPGTYNCQSGTTASGLSNCPTTDAFFMDVIAMNTAGTARLQVIHTLTKIFKRQYVNNAFSSWYKFEGTVVS